VTILAFFSIKSFFSTIMDPLWSAVSFLLMYAYKGWSLVTGPDKGITWVLAIMTLTVIVRTLLIPLFVKQINSARNMQLIQPKMKALQEKYGADRQRMGIEQQKLMKAEGVNPMASCFPLLLQMPIFFALFQVLRYAAVDRPIGYFFKKNPDVVDSLYNAKFFGARLAGNFLPQDGSKFVFGPTQVAAIILVLMMTGLFFVTQKQLMGKNATPQSQEGMMAQQQKMMLYIFPIMYLVIGLWIAVGVLVYWVTNNLWTLAQQWLLIRNNPTPGTPAYIEWEERMIKKGRDPKQIAEERRAKRTKAPVATSPTSRTVTGVSSTQATAETSESDAPATGIQRQQIQRQQPARQSRATRVTPKKKK